MKLIACTICGDLIQLGNRWKTCRCENIGGIYNPDGRHVTIYAAGGGDNSRVIGFPNKLFLGHNQEAQSWVINWSDKYIHLVDRHTYAAIVPASRCLECKSLLISTHQHDFRQCECPNAVFIDGGWEYSRGGSTGTCTVIYTQALITPSGLVEEYIKKGDEDAGSNKG